MNMCDYLYGTVKGQVSEYNYFYLEDITKEDNK